MAYTHDIDTRYQKLSGTTYEIIETEEDRETYQRQKSPLSGFRYFTGDSIPPEELVIEKSKQTEHDFDMAVVKETVNGFVESIQGELALVVFDTPNGYIERHISLGRLQAKDAAYPGARIMLTSKQIGSQTITDIENIGNIVPPAWEFDNPNLDQFFSSIKT